MQHPALIGIDIGTSSVKAVLSALDGTRLDGYAAAYPMARPGPGAAEQAPADWMRHIRAALDRFAAHPAAHRVAGIGITSQVNTHVFCGADGAALAPALTWQDTRAAGEGARLDARLTSAAKVAALGAPIPIDASHALARMAWVARSAPECWAATAAVMAPKDYAIAQLTGRPSADPLASVGLVGPDLTYAVEVLALVPGAAALLPPLADPLEVVGHVRAGLPFAGVPVAAGTMDAWASMFGLGVAAEGEAMYLSGTSEVMGLISARRTAEPGIVTFPDWRGITLHAAPTQAGGASLDWLCRLIGADFATVEAMAANTPIQANSPLFLPHLEGERAPLWDSQSRGAFIGMSSSTGPAELATAVMEGVAFSARLALEALERSGDRQVEGLSLGGGGAVSDSWNQIRADVLGRRLTRISAAEPGATGAQVMAGVAAGCLDDLAAATRALIRPDREFLPRPDQAALADRRFRTFTDLYAALRPIHRALDQSVSQKS